MVYIASPDAFVQNDTSLPDSNVELGSHAKNNSETMDCNNSIYSKSNEDAIRLNSEKIFDDMLVGGKDMDSAKDTSKVIDTLDLLLSDDETDAYEIRQSSKRLLAEGINEKTTSSVSLNDDEDLLLVINDKDEETVIKKNTAGDSVNEKGKVGEPVIENDRSQIILDDDDDILLSKSSANDVSKKATQEKGTEKSKFNKLFDDDSESSKDKLSTENNSLLKGNVNLYFLNHILI